jgi:hypothetical protein
MSMPADRSRRRRLGGLARVLLAAFIACDFAAVARARPLAEFSDASVSGTGSSGTASGTAPPPPAKPAPLPVGMDPEPLQQTSGSWVGAGFAFGVLNMPKLGAGVELIGEVRPRRFWPMDFTLVYWFDNVSELNRAQLDLQIHPQIGLPFPEDGSRLSVHAFQASAALCPYESELASGSLLLCAGVQGGLMHVGSEGLLAEDAQTRALFAFDAYVRWHFRLGSGVGISYSAGAFVPMLRDRFGYEDRYGQFHEQFRVGAVGARLDIAVTYGY